MSKPGGPDFVGVDLASATDQTAVAIISAGAIRILSDDEARQLLACEREDSE